jgi:Family of unknown function (DUF5681)
MAADLENEVGYRKPPKANQFQQGRSGNPSGRPRKPPGLPELLRKIAKQKVLTNTKNGPKRMTKLEASLTQLANKAASGDLKAVRTFVQMAVEFREAVKEKNTEQEATDARNKLLAALERYQG